MDSFWDKLNKVLAVLVIILAAGICAAVAFTSYTADGWDIFTIIVASYVISKWNDYKA
jgi:hypothetical protein